MEAHDFTRSVLDIDLTDILGNLHQDTVDHQTVFSAINNLIKQFHLKIPFQNLTLLAKEIGTHDVPSLEEIKWDVTTELGGLCYTNNVFMKQLFKTFGFDVFHTASTCNKAHPNNHIVTILNQRLTDDGNINRYLVDVGCGYPTYTAIPLDFIDETAYKSTIYTSSFLKFRFERRNNTFTRFHYKDYETNPGQKYSSENGEWERFYEFDLVPRPLIYFHSAMAEVYQNRFLKKLRLLVFQEDCLMAVKEHEDNASLIKITKEDTKTQLLRSDEEIIDALHKLGPKFSEKTIADAVSNWRYFNGKQ